MCVPHAWRGSVGGDLFAAEMKPHLNRLSKFSTATSAIFLLFLRTVDCFLPDWVEAFVFVIAATSAQDWETDDGMKILVPDDPEIHQPTSSIYPCEDGVTTTKLSPCRPNSGHDDDKAL